MAHTLRHRGPDDEGFFGDEKASIGNRRLAVIDLSQKGRQPMWNKDKTIAVVHNGEIYNFRELRKELEARGITFKSDTDTEVIAHGYDAWGKEIFNRFRGMWGCAVYDTRKNEIVLSRDFFGIKPLYYYFDGAHFVFASEVKAIAGFLEKNGKRLSFCKEGMDAYFLLGFTPQPTSIFQDIKKVKPGEVLTFDLENKKIKTEELPPLDFGTVASRPEDLERVLLESVEKHLIADVPVGVFLSGGVDSTLVALLLKKLGKRLSAFTVRIKGRHDADYAAKIAQFAGLRHREVVLDERNFGELYKKTWEMLDEPIADTSLIPSLLVAQTAARDVKVVMTGEGGDELFWGYPRYKSLLGLTGIYNPNIFTRLSETHARPESIMYLQVVRPLLRRARLLADKMRGNLLGAYIESVTAHTDFSPRVRVEENLVKMFKERSEKTLYPSFFDEKLYLPNDLLYKTDFATSAASIEGRVPLLDKKVYKFSRMLPRDEKYKRGDGKHILKNYLAANMPQNLLSRKKEGFSFPVSGYLFNEEYRTDFHEAIQYAEAHAGDTLHKEMLGRLEKDGRYYHFIEQKFPSFLFAILAFYKTSSKYIR